MTLEPQYVGLVIVIITNFLASIWWAATINNKMTEMEKRAITMENEQRTRADSLSSEQKTQDKMLSAIATIQARQDERLSAIQATLIRVEKQLDKAEHRAGEGA